MVHRQRWIQTQAETDKRAQLSARLLAEREKERDQEIKAGNARSASLTS
jgi:hypothetical protein